METMYSLEPTVICGTQAETCALISKCSNLEVPGSNR